jgi:dTDP-glucose pyrophosphorylase
MLKKFNNIILFGTDLKNNISDGNFSSIALVPIHGKPVIWWQLKNLLDQGVNSPFILVLNRDNEKLKTYVNIVLVKKFNIKIALVNPKKTILNSFKCALSLSDKELPTRLILGDTLVTRSINNEEDVIFTSLKDVVSDYWCLVETTSEGVAKNFFDKKKGIKNKQVIIGYYTFSNTKLIVSCVKKANVMHKKEISDILNLYKKRITLKTKNIDDWYDFGHSIGLTEIRSHRVNARSFNSIHINTELGLLSKVSTNVEKLKSEVFWYENIPTELKVLVPKLINFEEKKGHAVLTQELYGYHPLSEIFILGEKSIEDWILILTRLFKLHKYFEKYEIKKIKTIEKSIKWLYFNKTIERIKELRCQNSFWQQIFEIEFIRINGIVYKNVSLLINEIENYCEKLTKSTEITVCHGDFCFSNILFDSLNFVFKLIDPRGRLDNEMTIYSDPRYDIAKLRHSVCGLYDFIVNDLFFIKIKGNDFYYDILIDKNYLELEKTFDTLAVQNGFEVNDIRFIEGLLFLSMIPLHNDSCSRQKAFYLKAVVLINAVLLNGNYEKI